MWPIRAAASIINCKDLKVKAKTTGQKEQDLKFNVLSISRIKSEEEFYQTICPEYKFQQEQCKMLTDRRPHDGQMGIA